MVSIISSEGETVPVCQFEYFELFKPLFSRKAMITFESIVFVSNDCQLHFVCNWCSCINTLTFQLFKIKEFWTMSIIGKHYRSFGRSGSLFGLPFLTILSQSILCKHNITFQTFHIAYSNYNNNVFLCFLQLEKPIQAKGNVEMWLLELLNGAQWSLHVVIRDAAVAIKDPSFEMMNFFNTFPSQVC